MAHAILDDASGGFRVRALTRNPDSQKAKALAARGAEVVAADLDSEESLRAAFDGVHGVYAVTAYWEHFSPEKEIAQAHNMASAAKSAGVKHVVWSSLEDTRKLVPLSDNRMPTLMEKYKVPHFDGKGEADKFFLEAGVPATILLTSFYWDNLIYFGMGPKKGPDKYAFGLPMADRKLPGIARDDIGRCAYGIFKGGAEWTGRTVGIAGEHLTGAEMAAALSEELGVEVVHQAISFDAYRSLGFPGADDLGNMFQFKHDFNEAYCGARSVETSRRLNPALQTFRTWLRANANRIPLE